MVFATDHSDHHHHQGIALPASPAPHLPKVQVVRCLHRGSTDKSPHASPPPALPSLEKTHTTFCLPYCLGPPTCTPTDAPRRGARGQVAMLTIGPSSSGLASGRSWGPRNGCGEPGQGPGGWGAAGSRRLGRESHQGRQARRSGPAAAASRAPRASARMQNSPSFWAGLRAPCLRRLCPRASTASFSFFPPSLSFFPPPPLPWRPLPSPLLPGSFPFWGWQPRPHPPLQPRGFASQARVPEARAAPGPADAAGVGPPPPPAPGSGPGLTWGPRAEVLESMHRLVAGPSKNTHGVWASLSLE